MTTVNNDTQWGKKIENVLDGLESLSICLGGAAFTGFAIGRLFGDTQFVGAAVGAFAGLVFWAFHPHAPKN